MHNRIRLQQAPTGSGASENLKFSLKNTLRPTPNTAPHRLFLLYLRSICPSRGPITPRPAPPSTPIPARFWPIHPPARHTSPRAVQISADHSRDFRQPADRRSTAAQGISVLRLKPPRTATRVESSRAGTPRSGLRTAVSPRPPGRRRGTSRRLRRSPSGRTSAGRGRTAPVTS